MKCANPDCTCAELTTTDPCIVCGRGVHHICSNELYASGKLSERFCSAACVYQWKTATSPPSSATDSDIKPREPLVQPSETVLILLLDPRTKFSVESLIAPSTTPGTEKHASDGEAQQISEIVSAGSKLLVDAHREMFCSLHDHDLNAVETTAATTSPNLDLVPYADGEVICGAPIEAVAEGEALTLTLHEHADRVLEEWLQYTVDWVATAVQHVPEKTKTSDDFTPLLLVRRNGAVCWRVEAVCEHVDILRWFREVGSSRFPSVAALARIWLGRAPSNAFQERVFSTGGIVMSNRRTRTDNYRAEMQVLLKHNQKVIKHIETSNVENVTL